MLAVRKTLERALQRCVEPLARLLIRQYHLHVIQPAPLPHDLENFCRETRLLCHELCGRMKLLETQFEDVDVVLSSIVRELTRLQLQSEALHYALSATKPADETVTAAAQDYREAG
jgi:hypothetical protein